MADLEPGAAMRVLDLFSGIGGLSLGLERAGMTVVAHSEIDPYASRVLAKHWPTVPNLGDITAITEADLERLGPIDLVCGGFPCQDLSFAGKQAGINASRSGLFFDLMRVVRLVRPRYVLLENVPALLSRSDWMGAVLGELAASGFGAEWDCIPAQAVGAPHRRDRVFVVAYAEGVPRELQHGQREAVRDESSVDGPQGDSDQLAHPAGEQDRRIQQRGLPADAGAGGEDGWPRPQPDWAPEPGVGRVADGVPARVDRLRGLGNAIVPQVAEHVGRIIMKGAPALMEGPRLPPAPQPRPPDCPVGTHMLADATCLYCGWRRATMPP